MKFEWDPKKEKINFQQHGITFEQASYVFADPYALNKYDNEHSEEDEDRWLLLGKSMNEVVLVVVHTFKDQDGIELVRIISARKATKNESTEYQRRCPK
ncbi:MAG: BrnT family toxin [Candidatus Competibacteraceae bacterium]|nr:BrnT family toxin [Candidatus Competibacteraceae bacterium]